MLFDSLVSSKILKDAQRFTKMNDSWSTCSEAGRGAAKVQHFSYFQSLLIETVLFGGCVFTTHEEVITWMNLMHYNYMNCRDREVHIKKKSCSSSPSANTLFLTCKQHLQRGFQTLIHWSKALYNLLNSWSANWSSYLQGKETGAHQLGNRLFSSTTFSMVRWHSFWLCGVLWYLAMQATVRGLSPLSATAAVHWDGKNAGKMFQYDEWWPPNCAEVVRVDECVAALRRSFSSSSFPRHLLNTSFKRWTLSLYLLLMRSHGGIPRVFLHLK